MSFAVNVTPRFPGPTNEFENVGSLPLHLLDTNYQGFQLGDVQRSD